MIMMAMMMMMMMMTMTMTMTMMTADLSKCAEHGQDVGGCAKADEAYTSVGCRADSY